LTHTVHSVYCYLSSFSGWSSVVADMMMCAGAKCSESRLQCRHCLLADVGTTCYHDRTGRQV